MKWVDRWQADKVEVCFEASKADKKIIGEVVTRTGPECGEEGGVCGGIRGLGLDTTAPLMQSVRMEGH